ncbi:MAG: UbiH/UbiF/VisC/COQ6 family ubiquinone biosynthesis hydroxylase [Gammaproteobacteria bacterium]|nr:UbiH/UbiF/VisC/COQ6 family ubiquinone biosynthesis hydroxylase [Gammaproteobacteria bacterium]
MTAHYDVIIVGGGMVGATLAVALSEQTSLKIALIEAQSPSPISEQDAPDLRVSALTRASETLLKNLNIWQHLISCRISQFTDMRVWETSNSALHFDSADIDQPLLGHIIENRHLQQACLTQCKQIATIDILCPAKPQALIGNRLTLEDGRHLSADLIVGADGAHSPLREWANIETHGWDYQQSAVVCTVTTEKPHQHTAWQRFLPEGPLAFLPLANPHQCSIVWSNSTEEAESLQRLNDEAFTDKLSLAFEKTLGDIVTISQRASFPLKLRHADHYVESGFALVGDAAHTIHPLAGQGVNIGLLDAATLAEIVIEAHQKGRNIGSLHTLKKYQRKRKGDNLAMQLTMDAFKRVFGSDLAPLRWARRFGLKTVNQSTLLKNLFIHQASGHRFANPELSKHKG